MARVKVGAVIPAAGFSSRMGDFKPLLSIGPRTLLGHTISLFQSCGLEDIVVVSGHRADDLKEELERYDCRSVLNEHHVDGMFSSIQAGVKALDPANKGFFLLPVDVPLVQEDTVERLIVAMSQDPSSLVFYPEYQARRGHPPLITSTLIADILSFDEQGGLRALFKRYEQRVRHVMVQDPYVLMDVDTRDDLAVLEEHYLKSVR